MEKFYLAYGSNLNLEQMKFRCQGAVVLGSIILKNYRLVYKGSMDGAAHLTIEENEGSALPLGVFQISKEDELKLDRYEGYPYYYFKKYLLVNINNQPTKALIYIMNPKFEYHLPSNIYVRTCMKGYKDFNFDQTILEEAL